MSKEKEGDKKKKCYDVDEGSVNALENDNLPQIVRDLKEMIAIIYKMSILCKPYNLIHYISKELEVLVNKRCLSEIVMKEKEEEEEDEEEDEEEEKEEKNIKNDNNKEKKDEKENVKTACSKEATMKNSSNASQKLINIEEKQTISRSTSADCCGDLTFEEMFTKEQNNDYLSEVPERLRVLVESFITQSLYDQIVNQTGKSVAKEKIAKLCKQSNKKSCVIDMEEKCGLAWKTNGENSIYDLKGTPLQHYKRAYPHIFKRLIMEQKRRRHKKEPSKTKPYVCPKYWCPRRIVPSSLQSVDKSLQEEESNVTYTTDLKVDQISKSESRQGLVALIKLYRNPNDGVESTSIEDEEEEEETLKAAVPTEDANTQSDFCPVCDNHNLMQDVYFYGAKCYKMISPGKPLSFPCWTDNTYTFRAPVHIDWSSFLKCEVNPVAFISDTRKWRSDDCAYNKFYDYNLNFQSMRDHVKMEKFELSVEDPNDPFVYDATDDLSDAVYYSEDKGKYFVKEFNSKKWEPRANYLQMDNEDQLTTEMLVNILYPEKDCLASKFKLDLVDPLPVDMFGDLNEKEEEALLSFEDNPAGKIKFKSQ